jgi:hypothetical protein
MVKARLARLNNYEQVYDLVCPEITEDTVAKPLDEKQSQIMSFLHSRVFDPILASPTASKTLKQGTRYTIMQMEELDAQGMIQYYWSAIVGTEASIGFAAQMRREGFSRFEEALEEFRVRFDDDFLRRL